MFNWITSSQFKALMNDPTSMTVAENFVPSFILIGCFYDNVKDVPYIVETEELNKKRVEDQANSSVEEKLLDIKVFAFDQQKNLKISTLDRQQFRYENQSENLKKRWGFTLSYQNSNISQNKVMIQGGRDDSFVQNSVIEIDLIDRRVTNEEINGPSSFRQNHQESIVVHNNKVMLLFLFGEGGESKYLKTETNSTIKTAILVELENQKGKTIFDFDSVESDTKTYKNIMDPGLNVVWNPIINKLLLIPAQEYRIIYHLVFETQSLKNLVDLRSKKGTKQELGLVNIVAESQNLGILLIGLEKKQGWKRRFIYFKLDYKNTSEVDPQYEIVLQEDQLLNDLNPYKGRFDNLNFSQQPIFEDLKMMQEWFQRDKDGHQNKCNVILNNNSHLIDKNLDEQAVMMLGLTLNKRKDGKLNICSTMVIINPIRSVNFDNIESSVIFAQSSKLLIGHCFNILRTPNRFFAITMLGEIQDPNNLKDFKNRNKQVQVTPITRKTIKYDDEVDNVYAPQNDRLLVENELGVLINIEDSKGNRAQTEGCSFACCQVSNNAKSIIMFGGYNPIGLSTLTPDKGLLGELQQMNLLDVGVIRDEIQADKKPLPQSQIFQVNQKVSMKGLFGIGALNQTKNMIKSSMRNTTQDEMLKFYSNLKKIEINRLDDRPTPSLGCKFFRTKNVTCLLMGWNEKFAHKKEQSQRIQALGMKFGKVSWSKVPVPKVKNETWKKQGRTLCTITNVPKAVLSNEYALIIGGHNPYARNRDDLKKVFRFNLIYKTIEGSDVKIFEESEIVEILNIKGKTPLPLIGHISFQRDNKVFVLGGMREIRERENLNQPNLHYLDVSNSESNEWFQVFLGNTVKMLCAYMENSEEIIFGGGCKNLSQVKFYNKKPNRVTITYYEDTVSSYPEQLSNLVKCNTMMAAANHISVEDEDDQKSQAKSNAKSNKTKKKDKDEDLKEESDKIQGLKTDSKSSLGESVRSSSRDNKLDRRDSKASNHSNTSTVKSKGSTRNKFRNAFIEDVKKKDRNFSHNFSAGVSSNNESSNNFESKDDFKSLMSEGNNTNQNSKDKNLQSVKSAGRKIDRKESKSKDKKNIEQNSKYESLNSSSKSQFHSVKSGLDIEQVQVQAEDPLIIPTQDESLQKYAQMQEKETEEEFFGLNRNQNAKADVKSKRRKSTENVNRLETKLDNKDLFKDFFDDANSLSDQSLV